MSFVLDADEIKKAMNFRGVIVESVEQTFDGKEVWGITLYDRGQDTFRRTERVNNVEPHSMGYPASALKKRIDAYHKKEVNIKPTALAGFEGWECDFEVTTAEYTMNGEKGTSVKTYPVRRVGRIEQAELDILKARLLAERERARGGSASASPTSARPAASADLTPEQVDTLLNLYNGRTDEEVQAEAFRMNLEPHLYNLVTSGTAAQMLIGRSLLDITDDDKFFKVVE